MGCDPKREARRRLPDALQPPPSAQLFPGPHSTRENRYPERAGWNLFGSTDLLDPCAVERRQPSRRHADNELQLAPERRTRDEHLEWNHHEYGLPERGKAQPGGC